MFLPALLMVELAARIVVGGNPHYVLFVWHVLVHRRKLRELGTDFPFIVQLAAWFVFNRRLGRLDVFQQAGNKSLPEGLAFDLDEEGQDGAAA